MIARLTIEQTVPRLNPAILVLVIVLGTLGPAASAGAQAAGAQAAGASAAGQPATGQNERAPWHQGRFWAVGAQFSFPYDRFSDDYETGFGLQAFVDYPWIPLLDLTGGIGWNRFGGVGAADAVDVWELSGGLRFALGGFFLNGEVGWYSEVNDTSFIPGLGWRSERWEISLRTKAAGSNAWNSLRLGWYF